MKPIGIRYKPNGTDNQKDAAKLKAWKTPTFDEDKIRAAHERYLRELAENKRNGGNHGYFRVK